jgi:hypothetical protein
VLIAGVVADAVVGENTAPVEPKVLGEIGDVETVAVGRAIRVLPLLEKKYGRGRWRKLKGIALVRLPVGWSPELKYTGTRRTAWAAGTCGSSAS